MFNINFLHKADSPNLGMQIEVEKHYLDSYVTMEGLLREISSALAKEMYPEIKGRILADKTFKKRVINEVLALLAGELVNEVKKKK